MALQAQTRQFLVRDLDVGVVMVGVQGRFDNQAGARGGAGDQVDDGLMAHQRTATPVMGDEAEQASILFHFEVPGGKWETPMASPVRSASP